MNVIPSSLRNLKNNITALALTILASSTPVQAELDFSTYSCNPGEHLGNLPNSHQRVIALAYHNGYLLESVWATGVFNVYDLADPRHPVRMQSLDLGWAGHHNYIGSGSTLAWNFAGHHQIVLDDLPNLGPWSKVDFTGSAYMVPEHGFNGEQISYYPYGFGNVPHAYSYVQKNTVTIHDQRLPGNPQIGHINVLDENGPNIAKELSRSKGEIFRMAAVLENRGYIQRVEGTDRFIVTNRLFELGMQNPPIRNLIEIAGPLMHELASNIEQSCHLAVASGDQIVVVYGTEATGYLNFSVRIGHRLPLLESASGRTLLAFQESNTQERWLKKMRSKNHRAALRKRVTQIQSRGFEESASKQLIMTVARGT